MMWTKAHRPIAAIVTSQRPPLPVLTSLRFFAAAEVVAGHEATQYFEPGSIVHRLSSGAFQAVTFFFVLSGFILAYVYSGPKGQGISVPAAAFWRARVARILPGYVVGLALALPFFVYATFVPKQIDIGTFAIALVLVPAFLQTWWPPVATQWNTPAWSLSVEAFFYLLFPAIIAVSERISRVRFLALAYACVVVVAMMRAKLFAGQETGFGAVYYRYLPLFHLPQFVLGVALGRLFLFGPTLSPKRHAYLFIAGVAGLIFTCVVGDDVVSWMHADALLAPAFGLVVFGAARLEGIRVLSSRWLVLLGEASYAIYILHMPLGQWWNAIARRLASPYPMGLVGYCVAVVVVALLVFRYVERPLRRRILGHREHRDA